MLLLIPLSTFLVLATIALLMWGALVLWFTGRSKTKKATRPAPTLMSFFQPTAGKTTVDVPMPMASYRRSELTLLNREAQPAPAIPTNNPAPVDTQVPDNTEPELDDPTFAPTVMPSTSSDQSAPPPPTAPVADSPPTRFQLSLDRQLLSRLLSDDSLCEQFEEVRALTLERQRETGRSYASLFRKAIADKPTEVQDVLLNLLTEEETDDFDRSLPAYA